MSEDKEYAVLPEGNEIVKGLSERYSEVLWAVKPSEVMVMGVTNKEAPKTGKMETKAKIKMVDPITKALLKHFGNPDVKYLIDVYCSEWQGWSNARRQFVLFHELVHVPGPDGKGLIKHDVEDFSPIVDQFGTGWFNKPDLPDLLNGDPVAIDKDKYTKLHLK